MADQKRNAERLPLDVPFDALAGEVPVRVVEISLIGCRVEHTERLPVGRAVALRFDWKGEKIDVSARVARMELRGFAAGGRRYESGLTFASTVDEAPAVLRSLMEKLVEQTQSIPPEFVRAPFLRYDDEEELSKPYVQCLLSAEGKWTRRYASSARQPVEGFTTVIPADDQELDLLCRSYEVADPDTRRLIRLSLEVAMSKAKE